MPGTGVTIQHFPVGTSENTCIHIQRVHIFKHFMYSLNPPVPTFEVGGITVPSSQMVTQAREGEVAAHVQQTFVECLSKQVAHR